MQRIFIRARQLWFLQINLKEVVACNLLTFTENILPLPCGDKYMIVSMEEFTFD